MSDPRADRAASVDTGALYARTRAAFGATVVALADDTRSRLVPATPEWSVRDVLAHVVGLTADLNAQRFPGADDPTGTRWTAGQVARGRGRPVTELIADWDREGPRFESGLRAFGYEMGSHFVADLHAHFQDVRGALAQSRADDALTVRVALDHYEGFTGERLTGAGWGTLSVVAGGETARLGSGGPHRATVRAEPFEMLRFLAGRRSARQVQALEWEGDADAFVRWLATGFSGGYSLPDADLVE